MSYSIHTYMNSNVRSFQHGRVTRRCRSAIAPHRLSDPSVPPYRASLSASRRSGTAGRGEGIRRSRAIGCTSATADLDKFDDPTDRPTLDELRSPTFGVTKFPAAMAAHDECNFTKHDLRANFLNMQPTPFNHECYYSPQNLMRV